VCFEYLSFFFDRGSRNVTSRWQRDVALHEDRMVLAWVVKSFRSSKNLSDRESAHPTPLSVRSACADGESAGGGGGGGSGDVSGNFVDI